MKAAKTFGCADADAENAAAEFAEIYSAVVVAVVVVVASLKA